MQSWALIVDSFRQSLDRKIFWVLVVITLLIVVTMASIGIEPGKVTFLFGAWEVDTAYFTIVAATTGSAGLDESKIASLIVYGMLDNVVGTLGILLAIIATASFLPNFLEQGTIDVVLAKPMSRLRLFLGRYLGSMVFVFVHATLFVVLTFLVAGLRWGVWLPGYLLAIPLMVLLFSFLYCVSAWAGVRFRSGVVAIFITIGAWFVFAGMQAMGDLFEVHPEWQEQKLVYNTVRTARWILPKTQDTTTLAAKWSGAGTSADIMPDGVVETTEDRAMLDRATEVERDRLEINPLYSIGSSLLFEAVVVMLAVWQFSRRDF